MDIDEDPEQPRTTFDQGELEQLAETITLLGGVLQPIGLRAPVDGRYMLVFGARRYRASRLLGLADIPAIIVAGEQAGLAAQVIENQSRANLSNSDLAAVVKRLGAAGMKGKQIATVCGLTDYAVTMFRSVGKLPPFLSKRLDEGDMRAIYELFTAWGKHPAEIEAAMDGHDAALSVTEARRIIESATGRSTGSIFLTPKAGPVGEPEATATARACGACSRGCASGAQPGGGRCKPCPSWPGSCSASAEIGGSASSGDGQARGKAKPGSGSLDARSASGPGVHCGG